MRKYFHILFLLSIVLTLSCSIEKKAITHTKDQRVKMIESDNIEKDYLYPDSVFLKKYASHTLHSPNWEPVADSFYKNFGYWSQWIEKGTLGSHALELINSLENMPAYGHNLSEYHYFEVLLLNSKIESLRKEGFQVDYLLAEMDALLTLMYIKYATDIHLGRVQPGDLGIIWERHSGKHNIIEMLEHALANENVGGSIAYKPPELSHYQNLNNAFKQYSQFLNDKVWPIPGHFPRLKMGDTSRFVPKIKQYLSLTKDLPKMDSAYMANNEYDRVLKNAVKQFQLRHAIEPDGTLGPKTQNEMNVPLEYRANQIKANLERLRWLPNEMGERYIMVNVPSYKLQYVENGKKILEMKVIAGKIKDYTPMLIDTLSYIEFNPTWNVPHSIATEEMLPKIKRDAGYLQRNHYELRKGYAYNGKTIRPDSVDWSLMDSAYFPFRIVQKPGKHNALGLVKFIFPNRYAIYMHDTPSGHLFSNNQRDFSHGCIRLEDPFELAGLLLKDQGGFNQDSIQNILKKERTRRIFLEKEIPIYITYQTVWANDNDRVYFYPDVYGIDQKHIAMQPPLQYSGGTLKNKAGERD
jgi:L,D-transpeptidase YcbB